MRIILRITMDIKKIGCINIVKNLLTKYIKFYFVHYQIKILLRAKKKIAYYIMEDGNLGYNLL